MVVAELKLMDHHLANKPVVLKANMCFRDCKDFLWVLLSGDPVKSIPRAEVDF